jgi:hypothetical protein
MIHHGVYRSFFMAPSYRTETQIASPACAPFD